MSGPEPSERQDAFRADVARLVQAMHHHLSGRPPPDEVAALLGPVRHLADLLDAGVPAEHLREAALTAVDFCEWRNPEVASGGEGPALDPAILAARIAGSRAGPSPPLATSGFRHSQKSTAVSAASRRCSAGTPASSRSARCRTGPSKAATSSGGGRPERWWCIA